MLAPYLERLPSMLNLLKKQTVPVGARSIAVRPWELAFLSRVYKGEVNPTPPWADLVERGLALQIKILLDLDARGGGVPVDLTDPVMKTDLDQAATLLAELQSAINTLIAQGDRDVFKPLSDFRRNLYDLFFALKHGSPS